MRAEGARKKLALFKCISEGFIRKYAPKARKKIWIQKDGNDKSCFFLANVIFILFFSDRQVIFILLLFSSSFFKQSVIFNLKGGGFLTTNGR